MDVTATHVRLMSLLASSLMLRRREIGQLRKRYDNGLTQLEAAGKAVTEMQEELTALKPKLVQSKAETEAMQVTWVTPHIHSRPTSLTPHPLPSCRTACGARTW